MDRDQSFWNRFSGMYEKMQVQHNREIYGKVLEMTRSYITRESDVLELACGTGNITRELYYSAHSWIGTDYAEKMIDNARLYSSPEVRYEVQDATALTYDDSSFDIVLIANALHLMPEPEKALCEIRRVLKPDGLLLAPTFVFDGKVNRFKLWCLGLIGFPKTIEWTSETYRDYVNEHGFDVISNEVIKINMLPECYLVARC